MVSHRKEGTRRVGKAYLKYVADNEQAKEGKVLRTGLYATVRPGAETRRSDEGKAASLARLTSVT